MERSVERGTRLAWVALAVVAILPLTVGDQLPLLDWPQHLAIANIVAHLDDPSWHFAEYYELDPRPLPYRLFTWLVALLAQALPTAVAGRIVLALVMVGTPLALALVLRAFDRDSRLAWLAFPLAWSRLLFLGFVPFLMGIPLWLLTVAATERSFTGRGRAWLPGLLAVLVYFAHGWMALVVLGSLVIAALVRRPPLGRLVPFLPFLGLTAYWGFVLLTDPAQRMAPDSKGPPKGALFQTPAEAIERLPGFLFETHTAHVEETLFLLAAIVGAALVLLRRDSPRTLRDGAFELLAGALAVSYFLVPVEVGVAFDLPARNLLLAALLAPAFMGARPFEGGRALLLVPILGVGLALPVYYLGEFRQFERSARDIRALVANASEGGRTLGLVYDTGHRQPFSNAPYLHAQAWFQVYRGGDASSSFAGFPSIPVRYRPGIFVPHPDEWKPATLERTELDAYTRVIVRGPSEIPFSWVQGAARWESGRFQLLELHP